MTNQDAITQADTVWGSPDEAERKHARRLGRFRVSRKLLDDTDRLRLCQFLGQMIIWDARHDLLRQEIEYTADSELFDPVDDGCFIPLYSIVITGNEDGTLRIRAERRSDQ